MDNIYKTSDKHYTRREETMNVLTHWIGTIVVGIGSGCLITLSVLSGSVTKIASVSIYSFCMIMLYCASTLYHFEENESVKKKLKVLDHASIYLLIAGTYTPFLLINLKGSIGIILFVIVWSIALLGITAKIFFLNKFKKLSLAVYLVMGWIIVFAIKPLIVAISITGLIFIALGGIFYSGGVYFYVRKDKEFYHSIWHIFVLLGTIMHFFAVLYGSLLPIRSM
ncbi:MAG: hemolysin III family protein [Bacteroidetes bacterium]|nr:hemolysin III family protein [Bacteroidota bacterium]MCL2303268.1 hemolysin III family protein [Lentimicrobiaceae bacterium]